MEQHGLIGLTAALTEGQLPIKASAIRLDFSNPSDCLIRIAFATGKVESPVAIPPDYLIIEPCSYKSRNQNFGASDILYYASDDIGAAFYVTQFTK